MIFNKEQSVYDFSIIAFDTETSGAYPIESEIIELGAVKWQNGKVIDRFQTLLKPSQPLQPDNIKIHGITNEMVADAPLMKTEILKFCEFIEGSVLLAHHAPFDLGFLTLDLEKEGLQFPKNIHFCTSLLSRALINTTNHKLQTLIKELQLDGGAAHRAYDDANACLQVFMKCLEKLESDTSLGRLQDVQKKELSWDKYRIFSSGNQKLITLAKACQKQTSINIVYEGGQTKSKSRPIKPFGIVRNPDGDYVYAECGLEFTRKRFFVDKILDYELV
jgi:DNA polymerase-3 subunit epsilon